VDAIAGSFPRAKGTVGSDHLSSSPMAAPLDHLLVVIPDHVLETIEG
jgi:hypothetical protein